MTKVVKLKLISVNDDIIEFKELNRMLWDLQNETRNAANRAVQLIWEYDGAKAKWKETHGDYPKTKDEIKEMTGSSTNLQSLLYREMSGEFCLQSTRNLGSVIQNVMNTFKKREKDMLRGDMSIPSYRRGMPMELHNKSIAISFDKEPNGGIKDWYVTLSLLSRKGMQKYNLKDTRLKFIMVAPAKAKNSVWTILERCYDKEYKISGSKLVYEDGKWYLLLSYTFTKDVNTELDAENIMGVHIGEHNAVMAAFSNSSRVMTIEGKEIKRFSDRIEARRANIGQAAYKDSPLCGDGRLGRGFKRKMSARNHISETVTNFRNTVNHRYSRAIIEWAIKNNCGTIQLEDLTGLASSELQKNVYLKDWSYFDLTQKIEYKAKEHGIKVIKVGYKGLRKWCSQCMTATCERHTEEDVVTYECSSCGHVFDADKDVLPALLIKDIDELLKSSGNNEE